MTSTRTEYRLKRQQLIKDSIMLLMDMLTLEKKELEKIPTPFFNQLKKSLEKINQDNYKSLKF